MDVIHAKIKKIDSVLSWGVSAIKQLAVEVAAKFCDFKAMVIKRGLESSTTFGYMYMKITLLIKHTNTMQYTAIKMAVKISILDEKYNIVDISFENIKVVECECMYMYYLSRLVEKPTMWFPNRSDTNRAVQSQKMARTLKFWS